MGLNNDHGYVRIERIPKFKQLIAETSLDGNWNSNYYGDVVITNTKGGNKGNFYYKLGKVNYPVTYEGNNKWTIQNWNNGMFIWDDGSNNGRLTTSMMIKDSWFGHMFTLQ